MAIAKIVTVVLIFFLQQTNHFNFLFTLPPKSATTACPSSYSRILWLEGTRIICNDNSCFSLVNTVKPDMVLLCHPPVEVPVDDRLSEVVQVLHALSHIDGNDELGLQVNKPVH